MTEALEQDYLILGAGPGGLQLGYFLQQDGRDYRILEGKNRPGTFFEKFPRHRMFLSINKTSTGYDNEQRQLRYDWNSLLSHDPGLRLANYTKEYFPDAGDYVRYLQDYAKRLDLAIRYETTIRRVTRKKDRLELTDASGLVHRCRRLIVATGIGKPFVPNIPGIELGENYFDFSTEPEDYRDQRVLIIGKGNSAFETANSLTGTARTIHMLSPESVTLAWATHYVGHLRAINTPFLDTYHLKGQNSALDARIEKIEKVDGEFRADVVFVHARNQRMTLAYDRVLVCTGFRFDPSIFDESCRPELAIRDKLPSMTSEWESTNVPGMHFVGTLMQMRDFHKTMSNFLHGFRHNALALRHILGLKYHDAPLPHRELPLDRDRIAREIMRRATISPEMFLQPGFLCDAVALDESSKTARYHEGLPVDYIREHGLGTGSVLTITLEYGKFKGDPLNVERDPHPDKAHLDVYIHPVIRHFEGDRQVDEVHIPENLENDWGLEGNFGVVRTLGLPGVEGSLKKQREFYARRLSEFLDRVLSVSRAT